MAENTSDIIYDTLVKQFGIKFWAQYNNGYLMFEKYLQVTDMITNQTHFALLFDSQKLIKFRDADEFIKNFTLHIEEELKELDARFDVLQKMTAEGRLQDEYALFLEHEEIGHKGQKYNALLTRFKMIRDKKGES